ncbi:MAG TPA: nuclear transport factor 2 family protein [Thermoleophilaceae bacterium]|nr:nuclear transport factor 2 family protein [Thermoleophilaceae bacterium]
MSRENVEIALAVVDAVARMDGERLIELTHPEVEWHSFLAELGEGGVYRGHAGMSEYAQDLRDAWDVFSADVQDTLAVGEVVVLLSQLRYRGKGSGVDTESPAGHMAKFRDGRVIHMRSFREPEAAFEAVGLRE